MHFAVVYFDVVMFGNSLECLVFMASCLLESGCVPRLMCVYASKLLSVSYGLLEKR